MNKKQLEIVLAVLNAVKSIFRETNEFIDSTLKEQCEKEKMTADEVIFLFLILQKIHMYSLDKNFFFRFGTIVVVFCL